MRIVRDACKRLHCTEAQLFIFYVKYYCNCPDGMEIIKRMYDTYVADDLIPAPMVDFLVDVITHKLDNPKLGILPKDIKAIERHK